NGGNVQRRRLEHTPECRLKARGGCQCPTRRLRLGDLEAEIVRNRGRRQRTLSQRSVCAAEAGALPDGKDVGKTRAALAVGQGLHGAVAAWHEAMSAAQGAGKFG